MSGESPWKWADDDVDDDDVWDFVTGEDSTEARSAAPQRPIEGGWIHCVRTRRGNHHGIVQVPDDLRRDEGRDGCREGEVAAGDGGGFERIPLIYKPPPSSGDGEAESPPDRPTTPKVDKGRPTTRTGSNVVAAPDPSGTSRGHDSRTLANTPKPKHPQAVAVAVPTIPSPPSDRHSVVRPAVPPPVVRPTKRPRPSFPDFDEVDLPFRVAPDKKA